MHPKPQCPSGLLTALAALLLAAPLTRADTPVLVFDSNTYINLSSDIEFGSDFTIEYWFNTERDENWQILVDSATDKMNFQHLSGNTNQFWWWPNAFLALDETFDTNVWEHFALTRSGYTVKVYRSGTQIGERYSNHPFNVDRLGGIPPYSGHGSITPRTNYAGYASDIRIWDYARTQAEIAADKDRRLRGDEDGLVAYYRLDDGESNRTYNAAADAYHGTIVSQEWATTAGLSLSEPYSNSVASTHFVLADKRTGSEDFTNSNKVDVVDFPIPVDYDQYQITESSNVTDIVPGSWQAVSSPPTEVTFTEPGSDREVTVYAWFTNSTATVALRRAPGTIYYTTATPVPSVRAALSRTTDGFTVRIVGEEINDGSTGGTSGGRSIGIHAYSAFIDGGIGDETPVDPFVTLDGAGTYNMKLRLTNEAGNTAESAGICAVTVSDTASLPSGDLYVAVGNLNAGGGYTTWATAAASIQEAVDVSSVGDTVLVAPGWYRATTPADERVVETWLEPAPSLVGVGNSRDEVVIDGEGERGGIRLFDPDAPADIRIEGFTITNGYTRGFSSWALHGAGIQVRYNDAATPATVTVHNCAVNGNVGYSGGGLYIRNQAGGDFAVSLSDCVVAGNEARGGDGGGLYAEEGVLTLQDCSFLNNVAQDQGGGVFADAASVGSTISSCDFVGNTLRDSGTGGGIKFQDSSTDIIIDRCRFQENVAGDGGANSGSGGGLHTRYGNITIRNSLFTHNIAAGQAAAAYLWDTGNYLVENCTVMTNTAYGVEGGSQGLGAGLREINGTTAILRNSIVFHNVRLGQTGWANANGFDFIEYSCIDRSGSSNINTDPLIVDFGGGDFHLTKDSPCVDAGTNSAWMASAKDLDGVGRLDQSIFAVDMGCYEIQPKGTLFMVR